MNILIVAGGKRSKELMLSQDWDYIIACDGGYRALEEAGMKPDITMGDFDSMDRELVQGPIIEFPAEKDFTDLEAAIRFAQKKEPNCITVIGASGSRHDQFLSAVFLLRGRENVRLLDDCNEIFYRGSSFFVEKREGYYFSLLPLEDMEISVTGVKYPIDHVCVTNRTSLTISNEIVSDRANVRFEKGEMIVCFSKDA